MKNSTSISALYQKYLDNTCNLEELQEFLGRIEQPLQNQELKQMIAKELEEQGSVYERLPQVDHIVERLDQSMKQHVLNQKGKSMSFFSRTTFRYWSAAALFILCFGTLYYTAQRLNFFHRDASMYQNDIAPGTNKAMLTLADGKKIALDDAHTGTVAKQLDVRITKTEKEGLHYQADDKGTNTGKTAYNIITTPKGGHYEVVLSDGTKVFLNAASSISFPTSFGPTADRRVVLQGEGYFEVSHRAGQAFFVQSGSQQLKVLGTHFNVNAYPDENTIKTTLLQGSVSISYPDGSHALLKPGQQSYISKGKLLLNEVNAESAIDWQRGEMNVKDEDFQSTMRKIARWYNVDVAFAADAPTDLRLGGVISRQKSLVTVLKVLELTGEVHFKVEGRRVTVMR